MICTVCRILPVIYRYCFVQRLSPRGNRNIFALPKTLYIYIYISPNKPSVMRPFLFLSGNIYLNLQPHHFILEWLSNSLLPVVRKEFLLKDLPAKLVSTVPRKTIKIFLFCNQQNLEFAYIVICYNQSLSGLLDLL